MEDTLQPPDKQMRVSGETWSTRRTLPAGLAAELHAERVRRGLSLREVARRAGTAFGYLWQLERGQRCPSRVIAAAWIEALGLSGELADRLLEVAVTDAGRCYVPPAQSHPVRRSRNVPANNQLSRDPLAQQADGQERGA